MTGDGAADEPVSEPRGGDRSLRTTFDRSATRYHRARPRYPVELFEAFEELAGFDGPAELLEVGPATGVATEQLADRGQVIHAVELGPELAAVASAGVGRRSGVTITQADFETWEPPAWGAFDAVVAATAWHWIDPTTRYRIAHRHLRPGGVLAFWSALHVVPAGGDPFFAELQSVYDEIGEGTPADHVFPEPGGLETFEDEIAAEERFELVAVRHFDWEITYDAERYLDLLDTFSGHLEFQPWQRRRLYGEIERRLGERPDGLVRRHWGAALHVARRLG